MVIDFNITDAHLDTLSFNGSAPLVLLNSDFVTVQLNNLDLKILLDFEFISDPPILADIGQFFI